MSKQDRQGVRTPADIERKYDLGQLNALRGQSPKQDLVLTELTQKVDQFVATTNGNIENINNEIDDINEDVTMFNGNIENINNEIDDINKDVTMFNGTVTELNTKYDELNRKVAELGSGGTGGGEVTLESILAALGYTPVNDSGCVFGKDDVKFYTPSSTGSIALHNSSKAAGGAGLWLYGNANSGAGKFRLQVYDESASNYRAFDGETNGNLKWDGGYLNPPMVAGTEYLTIERYENKPVYVQLINFGTMPNTAETYVSFTKNLNVISIEGKATNGNYMIPLSIHNAVNTVYYNKSSGRLYIGTSKDASAWSAEMVVKYTK